MSTLSLPRALSRLQERKAVEFLEDSFQDIESSFKKRSEPSLTRLPTLSAYLDAMHRLLAFVLQIPPIDPSTPLRTAFLLRLTSDVMNAVPGYPPTLDDLPQLLDFLDFLDQAWVTVLHAQVWDPAVGTGVDLVVPAAALDETAGHRPMRATPVSQTERTRLHSLLVMGTAGLEEWLSGLRIPGGEGGGGETGDAQLALERAGFMDGLDDMFAKTLATMGGLSEWSNDPAGMIGLPVGNPFPYHEIKHDDLEPVLMTEMTLSFNDRTTTLTLTRPSAKPTVVTAPARYSNLLRRFVWRQQALTTLALHFLDNDSDADTAVSNFKEGALSALTRNLVYGDTVVRHSIPQFRRAASADAPGNVRFFDIFMLEECYVCRHEPAAAVLWQRHNPTINLRTVDPFKADWRYHVRRVGQDWNGEVHGWNPQALGRNRVFQQLVEQAARLYNEWYDHPYPQLDDDRERYYAGDVLADLPSSDEEEGDGQDLEAQDPDV